MLSISVHILKLRVFLQQPKLRLQHLTFANTNTISFLKVRFSFDIFGCARQYEQALYCTRLHENSRQAKVNKFSLVFWLNEIVQKKYSAKYGAALVSKVVGLFKNNAQVMDCPIGTPLVLLQELGRVMQGEDNIFLTQRPYNEYVIGNNRFKHFNFNGVRMIFKNGRLTDKSDWSNI